MRRRVGVQIESVTSPAFAAYGRVVNGFEEECAALVHAVIEHTPLPERLAYEAMEPALQQLPEAQTLRTYLFGGMPCQFGWCSGYNTKLNCLEYHRVSEYNLGATDFILLLAKQQQIENGTLDTARVAAFRVPAGTMVEIFPDTLHYAPCQAAQNQAFRVVAIMPQGANTPLPEKVSPRGDGRLLWAKGKWLLAHPEAPEASQGAYIGLTGENIDVSVRF